MGLLKELREIFKPRSDDHVLDVEEAVRMTVRMIRVAEVCADELEKLENTNLSESSNEICKELGALITPPISNSLPSSVVDTLKKVYYELCQNKITILEGNSDGK